MNLIKNLGLLGLSAIAATDKFPVTNQDFSCNLDNAVTYTFTSGVSTFIVGGTFNTCDLTAQNISRTGAAGSFVYTISGIAKTCFTARTQGTGTEGNLTLLYSPKDEFNAPLIIGKTTQKLSCNLERVTTLSYQFSTVTVLSEDEDDQTTGGDIVLKRKTANYAGDYPLTSPKTATSGDAVYFEVTGDVKANELRFDIDTCKITNGTNTYYLAKLYESYCVEDFLTSTFIRTIATVGSGDTTTWQFSYKAFTFTGADDSNTTLSCDLLICTKDGYNFCKKNDTINHACAADTGLTATDPAPVFTGKYIQYCDGVSSGFGPCMYPAGIKACGGVGRMTLAHQGSHNGAGDCIPETKWRLYTPLKDDSFEVGRCWGHWLAEYDESKCPAGTTVPAPAVEHTATITVVSQNTGVKEYHNHECAKVGNVGRIAHTLTLVTETSNNLCVEGTTYGNVGYGNSLSNMWVKDGCSGTFKVTCWR